MPLDCIMNMEPGSSLVRWHVPISSSILHLEERKLRSLLGLAFLFQFLSHLVRLSLTACLALDMCRRVCFSFFFFLASISKNCAFLIPGCKSSFCFFHTGSHSLYRCSENSSSFCLLLDSRATWTPFLTCLLCCAFVC